MSLIDAAMSRSRTVLSVLVLLLASGAYAYLTISKESDPDIDIPIIYVSMHLDGISPQDSERLLLRPMEKELASIEGVDEVTSNAYQSGGSVVLEFQSGFDKDAAMTDVRRAVDKVRPDLPDEVDEPLVDEVNLSLLPVLVVTLSGNVSQRTLLKLAQDIQDKIEGIPSVLEANIAGERDEVLEVIISPQMIESYGLEFNEILPFFMRSNNLIAAGNLDTGAGRFAIKVPGLFEDAKDIMAMPILAQDDSVIRLSDIATLRPTFKDHESFARMDGQSAIAIEVVKRTGENILDTIASVRQVVGQESKSWPKGVEVGFTQDDSKNIKTMLRDLHNNTISAVILVMIIVVWALGARAALLVGVAIPGAFLTGILILWASGLTVNIVVLFSLILSVGMLVDGAIVVTEYADREMAHGAARKKAYKDAAKRMAWPIIASTATTLAAFSPLLFWPDTVGEFMRYMPITLIAVLSASLAMALIFVPVLGSLIGKAGAFKSPDKSAMVLAYKAILEKALRRPFLVLLMAFALLVGVWIAYIFFGKGVQFFPNIEPELAIVQVHARGNLSVWEKDALVRQVENKVLGTDGVESVYARSGSQAKGFKQDADEDVIGQIFLQFEPWGRRPSASKILDDIRLKTADIAGINVEIREQRRGPSNGKAVQMELSSRIPDKIPPMVGLMRSAIDEVGDFRDVQDSRPLPTIEWEINVDRAQAAKFGLDIATIGAYIRMVTNGLIIGEYRPDSANDEVDITIRYPFADRTIDQLKNLKIPTKKNGLVPIEGFVDIEPKPATSTISRVNQRRVITIAADLPKDVNTDQKVDELISWMSAHKDKMDPDVSIEFKGDNEKQLESQTFLIKALLVALFIMAIILVTQFNSFSSALLILSSVIMSTIGVMIGLLITGQPFGIIMSGVGVIALAGIIVNNNIVLIDTFDTLRASSPNMPVREIILQTGVQRLRPVLLTTVTTVVGLLPMVLQINIDFIARDVSIGAPSTQWWVQLSSAIVFGLTFSTLLTLIVTPCALSARDIIISKLKNKNAG